MPVNWISIFDLLTSGITLARHYLAVFEGQPILWAPNKFNKKKHVHWTAIRAGLYRESKITKQAQSGQRNSSHTTQKASSPTYAVRLVRVNAIFTEHTFKNVIRLTRKKHNLFSKKSNLLLQLSSKSSFKNPSPRPLET